MAMEESCYRLYRVPGKEKPAFGISDRPSRVLFLSVKAILPSSISSQEAVPRMVFDIHHQSPVFAFEGAMRTKARSELRQVEQEKAAWRERFAQPSE